MKQRILDKVEEAFLKAEAFYGKKFSRPEIITFKRKGRVAGTCNYHTKELTFHIAIAEQEGDKFINRTPAHEVAHWIDAEYYGYKFNGKKLIRHGAPWVFIMENVMKQDSSRCHSFDTTAFRRKRAIRQKFEYSCTGGHNLMISSVCHNRIVRGTHRYKCKCGGKISLRVPSKEEQIAELEAKIKLLTTKTYA